MRWGSFAGGMSQGLLAGGNMARQVALDQAHTKLQMQQQEMMEKFRAAEEKRWAEQSALGPLDKITTPETAEAALPFRSPLMTLASNPEAEVKIPGAFASSPPGLDLSTGADMPAREPDPLTMRGEPARQRLYADAGQAVTAAHQKALETAFSNKMGLEEMKASHKQLADLYKAARASGMKHEDAVQRMRLGLIQQVFSGRAQIPPGMTIDDVLNSAVSVANGNWAPTTGAFNLPGQPSINPPGRQEQLISADPTLPPVPSNLGVAPVPPGRPLPAPTAAPDVMPPSPPVQGAIGPPGAQQTVGPGTQGQLPTLSRPAPARVVQMLSDAKEAEGYLESLANAFGDPRGPKTGLLFAVKTNPTLRAITSILPQALQPSADDAAFSSSLGNHILTYARSKFPGRISNYDVQFLQSVVPRPQYTAQDNLKRSNALKVWAKNKRMQIEEEMRMSGQTVPGGPVPSATTGEMMGNPPTLPIPEEWK